MEYYVEKLDADAAVCMSESGEICCVSREKLPDDLVEGCVLREENGAYLLDLARTEARKSALLALQDSLFGFDAPAEESQ